MLVDLVVERALARGQSVLLEKTMVNLEPVMDAARKFSAAGCFVHLLGTHIQPFCNWAFLENRMASGQAFGRYITKDQAITGLRNYQQNLEAILESPTYRGAFDSIHVYDVMEVRRERGRKAASLASRTLASSHGSSAAYRPAWPASSHLHRRLMTSLPAVSEEAACPHSRSSRPLLAG